MKPPPKAISATHAFARTLSALLAFVTLLAVARAGEDDKSDWWSFKAAARPSLPSAKGQKWARNPVDVFILARLESLGLSPSPEADRRTLLRRLSFDLTGLPPTPEEVAAFLRDRRRDAYEKAVDQLLASPRYGERWARHWLDTVHYGETHGYDKDKPRANAWPYRDYVIRALNEDKPYSRFVQEQLAGDVLFPDEPDGIAALGFIAAGPWDFVGHVELPIEKTDGLIARYNDRDDMVMTTMSTFQSLTVHCARCHDHKFDPISMRDYYSLQAVFAGVDRAERPYDADKPLFNRRRELTRQQQELALRFAAMTNQPAGGAAPDEFLAVSNRLEEVNRQLAALPAAGRVYAATSDFKREGSFGPPNGPRPVHLLTRGDVKRPGELMSPAGLPCVPGPEPQFTQPNKIGPSNWSDRSDEALRRAALAKWITDPGNLLTRRSLVNRVWHYHFGRGLVETPNDFGHMGARPTHPELLDWLAFWFADNGESLKKLHRLIVTSAAYRQGSATLRRDELHESPASAPGGKKTGTRVTRPSEVDADNRYLWRMNRTRLDAETIHDTMLAVSGKLDLTMGGPSVQQFFFKDDHSPVYDYTRFDVGSPAAHRRSIYRFIVRSVPDPLMESLDCPDASILTPKRNVTVTSLQALAVLNNPFVLRQSEHLAARVAAAGSLRGQVVRVYQLALNRPPTAAELKSLVPFAERNGLASLGRLVFNTSEFMFVD